MAWKIEFEQEAEKELALIDRQQAKRILKYLFERIATPEDPRRFGKALRFNLSGFWKYRIGNYRVICDIQDETVTVLVLRIGHRKKVYKKIDLVKIKSYLISSGYSREWQNSKICFTSQETN